ncbi:DNA translocase SftA [Lentibacillus kapialis]|uniref:DNA translocase SftA n=1 Tax=Lentibacillus kapialis TaxID=340214 RepID=A0A917Q1Z7_9BACI|nr:DNA translocase FtsK [Lentibacillus kapialis]GGK06630.1 DNA translocase SftA [Lentibacillus kapialis]
MWDRWKKKISNFFFEEKEESNDSLPEKPVHNRQDIHTRMTYQYPAERRFRFPVIPDQPKRNDQSDVPAFQRKRPRDRQHLHGKQHSNDKEQSEPEYESYDYETEENEKTYKKESNEPFMPTEVPSPIYGFHDRYTKEGLEDVPTFQRNRDIETDVNSVFQQLKEEEREMDRVFRQKQDSDHTRTPANRNRQHENDRDLNEMFQEEKYYSDDSEDTSSQPTKQSVNDASDSVYQQTQNKDCQKETLNQFEQNGVKQSKADERSGTNDTEDAVEIKQNFDETNKSNTNNMKKPVQREQRSRRERKQRHHNNESKTPPFNVLMSANDKRNLHENRKPAQKPAPGQESDRNKSVPYHLLDDPVQKTKQDHLWMKNQQQLLEKTLKYFNVRAKVVNTTQGPSVTRFEVQPELGVKVSKIRNLSDDLKLNMAAKDIRIEAPIPGKNTVGIEIPNQEAQTVTLQEIFEKDSFQKSASPLTIGLGLNIEGDPVVTNIQKMPHGLIAGATGSGKSVCINTILISLLYKANYEEVKFMLIDPKMVELAPFNGIPNLISPVITDVKAATAALKWAVREMEERYDSFVREGVRDIERFNQKMVKEGRTDDKMPFIVIVIDELADLMMVAPQDVEDSISRIAQKARACGIHLLLATQRPSVDVITGLIKANIPTRIAFSVSSQVDSKTILDTGGAEKLLGKGDMLFTGNGSGKSVRLQGAFVSDDEIERVTDYARSIADPVYEFEQEHLLAEASNDDQTDDLLNDAIQFVIEHNSASTSLLQRHFKVGYNRAARLMDAMEAKGIIAQQNGSKPREVLVSAVQTEN